jgi:hypothetical protein
MTVALQGLDFFDDPARFVTVGIGFVDADRLAAAGFGPQVLAQALGVVLDDGVRRVEDVAVGALVLLQPDHVGNLELAYEVAHVADVGAAKSVD